MPRLVLVLAVLAAPALAAQPNQPGRPNREALQREIVERFMQNYQNQAGLDEAQAERFRSVVSRSFRERRQLEMAQRRIFRAIEGQLRPGVAADADSLQTLLASLTDLRHHMVEQTDRDDQELAEFLTPVQHAQLVLSMERFQRQVQNILRRRAQQGRSRSNNTPGA